MTNIQFDPVEQPSYSLAELLQYAGEADARHLLSEALTHIGADCFDSEARHACTTEDVDTLLKCLRYTPQTGQTANQRERLSCLVRACMKRLCTCPPSSGDEGSVTEKRPEELECDVVRFQNNKEKWVAFVGLLDGRPYEIFTGLQDDEEGIVLPKTVNKGRIIKKVCSDGTKRYDFQFQNRRGYKTTVEGLSEKFNKEYWNYAKLISGVLRYRMPIGNVIRLVDSLQLESESINTWKAGVSRALKKYMTD